MGKSVTPLKRLKKVKVMKVWALMQGAKITWIAQPWMTRANLRSRRVFAELGKRFVRVEIRVVSP